MDRITDYHNDIYQPEDFHDDAFQMMDTASARKKDAESKKENKEGHKNHKAKQPSAEARPVSCAPDDKAGEFNRQARHGAGRKETAKKKK